jgi:hypothetical protein
MGTSGDLSLLILGFHHFRVSMAQQGMLREDKVTQRKTKQAIRS